MKLYFISYYLLIYVLFAACKNDRGAGHVHQKQEEYTCPMHPEVIRNQPGTCPICGMDLVMKGQTGDSLQRVEIGTLLKPANSFVVAKIPVTAMEEREQEVELSVVGRVAYDTRQTSSISSRVNGRIDRLYINYKYQKVTRGDRIMDIYSQELVTAQQNLLFVLKNDATNSTIINAAKNRLLLLGMTSKQVEDLVKSRVLLYSVPVFSKYSGYITDQPGEENMSQTEEMETQQSRTQQLSAKEGMYVRSGQPIFSLYDASKVSILLDIYPDQETLFRVGNAVRVAPETAPDQSFRGKIDYIEPVFRQGNKTLNARIYLNNASLKLPIGTRVSAIVFSKAVNAWWLPAEAVVTLGRDKVVFKKEQGGFKPQKITAGMTVNGSLQVLDGLKNTDSVAANAQYLVDNEAFIKANNQ